MKPHKIQTQRSPVVKFLEAAFDLMERSWYPALCFYALLAAALFAINYKG